MLAEAAGQIAELVVLVVRHHASGWVREIARKDEDSQIEASFDPESGIVTVYFRDVSVSASADELSAQT